MNKLLDKIEHLFVAITFAEAGEDEASLWFMDESALKNDDPSYSALEAI